METHVHVKMTGFRAFLIATASACASFAAPADASPMVAMPQSVVTLPAGMLNLGAADPAAIVHFTLAFDLRDKPGLDGRLAAGQKLSFGELAAAYLPTPTAYGSALSWLRGAGLSIDRTTPDRLSIGASGPVATVSAAFGVHFSRIQAPDGKVYVSADSVPFLPAALSGAVIGINGLQPSLHAFPLHVFAPRPNVHVPGISPPFQPAAIVGAYAANGLSQTGTGTATAIVIDTFPLASDLTTFWSETGVPQSLSNITFKQVVSGTLPATSGEETLDTEWSSSMAPASKVRVYASQSLSFANLDEDFQAVISDLESGVTITQVSISLGACETQVSGSEKTTDDNYFATMTSLGATVFVSTGDSGSRECGGRNNVPSFYATSPHVAAAGGTTLTIGNSVTETGWSDSGGGLSTYFATPSFQSGITYPSGKKRLSVTSRGNPDISADANPNTGVLIIFNGKQEQIGGTSVASPVLAGLFGLVNQARVAAGKPTLGLLGPRIYSLIGTSNLRDETSGSNGGYSAGTGYDLVTGVGSPLFSALLPTLVAQN